MIFSFLKRILLAVCLMMKLPPGQMNGMVRMDITTERPVSAKGMYTRFLFYLNLLIEEKIKVYG